MIVEYGVGITKQIFYEGKAVLNGFGLRTSGKDRENRNWGVLGNAIELGEIENPAVAL